jgi:hypothetical protein
LFARFSVQDDEAMTSALLRLLARLDRLLPGEEWNSGRLIITYKDWRK